MSATVDTSKAERKFLNLVEKKKMERIGVAAGRVPFSYGLKVEVAKAGFAPNSPGWLERKKKRGWGQRPWVRTGKTLAAISNNPPAKLGTKKGLQVGYNKRGKFVFFRPRAFTDSRGKRLPAKRQELALTVMARGSGAQRLRNTARKRGRSFGDVFSESLGVRKAGFFVPGRPLLRWVKGWFDAMEGDIERAVRGILKDEGLDGKD